MLVVYAAALVTVVLAAIAARDPIVRRIGLRNAVRRPREAALVMLGCVLGTALIVGNASVGDSFTVSNRLQALGDLGTLDAQVKYESPQDWAAANAHLAATALPEVETSAAVAVMRAPVTTDANDTTAPRTNLIEADYRRAGSLGAARNTPVGAGPAAGEAWASKALTERLSLRLGTRLTVHTEPLISLTVTKIVKNPLVSFLDGSLRPGDGLLVPPGTVVKLQAQNPKLVVPDWLTLVVGRQPHTDAAPDPAKVEALRRSLTRAVTPFSGEVSTTRADALRFAIASGKSSASFLTTIGGFGIIAGILLLINVLLMLAEERLAELGTMRAVGLSRVPLIGSFCLEGGLYAAVGSFFGGACGVALGRLLVFFMNQRTNAHTDSFRALPLHFSVTTGTVLKGVATGYLVSVIAVVATSYRVSRLDVIRSLRGLPDQSQHRRRVGTPAVVMLGFLGALVTYYGYAAAKATPFLLGPIIITVALGVVMNRRFGWEAGMVVAAVPLVIFAISFNAVNPERVTGPTYVVLSGVVAVTAGVFLVNAMQTRLAKWLRGLGRGRSAVPTRLGLANPVAHRVRMLLTVGPFALVIFTLSYAEGLSHLISSELSRTAPILAGDYTLFAESTPVKPYDFTKYSAPGVKHVAPVGTALGTFRFDPDKKPKAWPVSGFTEALFSGTAAPPPLIERDPKYKTDKDAYEAVLKNPDLMIVSGGFLLSGGFGPGPDDPVRPPAVGDTYTMFSPITNQARDVTVAALRHEDLFAQGPFYGEEGMRSIFGTQFALTDAFILARDDHAVIDNLQRLGVRNGVVVRDIEDTARAQFAAATSIINLFRSDLGIGVIVGVAGIAVVLVRSVRDRRHQIGVLRAMGVDSAEMGKSFMIEGAFVSAQGLLVGTGFGVLTVAALTKSELIRTVIGFAPPMRPPPVAVLLLTVGLFIASLLASALPARSASKIPPAVALRLVD
ncbi:MAG TPA: FtsX-like permease family protein [Acidimicrobiales bacterium]|nr:FtsX-like permease family protein [Acidimicrobiales bacterium]